ncbi:MAG: GNAT family N-acetyltransferase [Chitinophagaceae bacterium]
MSLEIITASNNDREVIKNLLQLYIYDFTEYIDMNVDENGLFKLHVDLNEYWTEEDKHAYLIKQEGKYAGFALVKMVILPTRHHSIAEFFILKKYRKKGIGQAVAEKIFDSHPGEWEVHQTENNVAAQKFWNSVIARYTDSNYSDHFLNGKRIQTFKNEKKDKNS